MIDATMASAFVEVLKHFLNINVHNLISIFAPINYEKQHMKTY